METVIEPIRTSKNIIAHSLLGSSFMALLSLVWIPTLPIATTLQTLALFILSLSAPPRVSFMSCIFYLVEATLGFPVLCGHSNSIWFLGSSAGYLFAFPIASAVMSSIASKKNYSSQIIALLVGQAVIYLLGWLILSVHIGVFAAFQSGVLFFIPSDLIKIGFAVAFINFLKK